MSWSTETLLERCREARDHGMGPWSTGEKLMVALVLNDSDQLKSMGYTFLEAFQRVQYGAASMSNEPTDWLRAVQEELKVRP